MVMLTSLETTLVLWYQMLVSRTTADNKSQKSYETVKDETDESENLLVSPGSTVTSIFRHW